jgi:hypothetical protein
MRILCHYTKNETAKIILENMTLRFGKVVDSNDPVKIKSNMKSAILGIYIPRKKLKPVR